MKGGPALDFLSTYSIGPLKLNMEMWTSRNAFDKILKIYFYYLISSFVYIPLHPNKNLEHVIVNESECELKRGFYVI